MSEYSHDFSMYDESDVALLHCKDDDAQMSSRSHLLPALVQERGLIAGRKHFESLSVQVTPYSERRQSGQPDTGDLI